MGLMGASLGSKTRRMKKILKGNSLDLQGISRCIAPCISAYIREFEIMNQRDLSSELLGSSDGPWLLIHVSVSLHSINVFARV